MRWGLLSFLASIMIFMGSLPGISQIVRQPIPDKLVVLTFDDAVSTHATFVGPLLKKYGFGGTFFVCEFPPDFEDKHKYMRWEQIQQLARMGFEIGNHTWKHTHVNTISKARLEEELHYIENKCETLGMEKPVSFAYPAYETDPSAIGILQEQGYLFARVGGDQAYDPEKHHPYLMPSFSTTKDNRDQIFQAFQQAKEGKIVVLTVHGVPDYAHEWVTTPPALFEEYMKYLHDHHFQVIAMKDLVQYIDVQKALDTIEPAF